MNEIVELIYWVKFFAIAEACCVAIISIKFLIDMFWLFRTLRIDKQNGYSVTGKATSHD